MRKVLLKYGFIFEPTEIWQTQSSFEEDIAEFFRAKGFCAELIETAHGQESIPLIYLTKDNQQKAESEVEFDVKSTS